MKLTAEHKDYLARKHRGGLSNRKGNTYEDIYATKEIIRLFANEGVLDSTYVASQIEGVFVDDFQIIHDNGLKIYHQCKDTKSLSWEMDEKGEPFFDFRWQKAYSVENKESFLLKIVYSNDECKIHTEPIPDVIADVTEKEHFPAHQSLNAFMLVSEPFRNHIKSILPANKEYSYDVLLNFALITRSIWEELSAENRPVPLSEIKDEIIGSYRRTINFGERSDVELSYELKLIFDRFPGFYYCVNGNFIDWSFKEISGQFYLSDELISCIIENDPSEIFDLIKLFN